MIQIGAVFRFWCFFSSHFAPIVGKQARIVKAEDELKKEGRSWEAARSVGVCFAIYGVESDLESIPIAAEAISFDALTARDLSAISNFVVR